MGDYWFDRITQTTWNNYCGLVFQLFCEKNIDVILRGLDILDTFEQVGTYWQNKTVRAPGIQIDLVIECSDHTTYLIECKWSKNKIGMGVVDELNFKKKWYPNPKGHTLKNALIASHGVTKSASQDTSIISLKLADFF